ncbi:MAG: hypothetical protein H6707_14795 [Deltaproteobacteria bacterium]|nr:hypothetical protein [Deltaproteobacteria bacterium]
MSILIRAASAHIIDQQTVGLFLVSDPLGLFQIPVSPAPFAEIVAKLGVTGSVVACQASYCRNLYWSDYPDDNENWVDQWYAIGRVQLTISSGMPDALGCLAEDDGIEDLGEQCLSFPHEEDHLVWTIVADFPSAAALAQAQEQLRASSAFQSLVGDRAGRSLFESSVRDIKQNVRPQLICDLGLHGPEFWKTGTTARQQILALLESANGSTHHYGLL